MKNLYETILDMDDTINKADDAAENLARCNEWAAIIKKEVEKIVKLYAKKHNNTELSISKSEERRCKKETLELRVDGERDYSGIKDSIRKVWTKITKDNPEHARENTIIGGNWELSYKADGNWEPYTNRGPRMIKSKTTRITPIMTAYYNTMSEYCIIIIYFERK